MSEEDPIEREELLEMLDNPELLLVYGYQLTPKGCMALVLMKYMNIDVDLATDLSQKMDDLIFMNSWIYLQESQLEVKGE